MARVNTVLVHKAIRENLPKIPFEKLKNKILGKHYDLSLVFIGESKSRSLNKKYRGKDTPTNILTFPLSKTSGEIFITPRVAKRDAPLFNQSYREFLMTLLIHGLLHLKGFRHGSRMEKSEKVHQRHVK